MNFGSHQSLTRAVLVLRTPIDGIKHIKDQANTLVRPQLPNSTQHDCFCTQESLRKKNSDFIEIPTHLLIRKILPPKGLFPPLFQIVVKEWLAGFRAISFFSFSRYCFREELFCLNVIMSNFLLDTCRQS